MSQFQTNTLFGAAIISILRYVFCVYILHIDRYVGGFGVVASMSIGLWMGRGQKRLGFVGTVFTGLTVVSFFFSIIPVYNYKPSLEVFNATQIPQIVCDTTNSGILRIESIDITMNDVCKRGSFPVLANQSIQVSTKQPIVINLGLGNSATIPANTTTRIQIQKDGTYSIDKTNKDISINNPLDTRHITIKQTYITQKKEYLQKNFPRTWEYAPSVTKIALRKMRLLSLIDRSYNDKITYLNFYLQEVK